MCRRKAYGLKLSLIIDTHRTFEGLAMSGTWENVDPAMHS